MCTPYGSHSPVPLFSAGNVLTFSGDEHRDVPHWHSTAVSGKRRRKERERREGEVAVGERSRGGRRERIAEPPVFSHHTVN